MLVCSPNVDALRTIAGMDTSATLRYGSKRNSVEVTAAECAAIVQACNRAKGFERTRIEKMVARSKSDFEKCRDFCLGRERPKGPPPMTGPSDGETAMAAAMRRAAG